MHEYLRLEDMEPRCVYRLQSRNLVAGLWLPDEKGFKGIREKLGHEYLFVEYHWDNGTSFSTAKPLQKIVTLPVDLCEDNSTSLYDFLKEIESSFDKTTGWT